jgi:uncharacterized membrane protein
LISIFLCIISCLVLRAGPAAAAADFDLNINGVKLAGGEKYDLAATVGYAMRPSLTVMVINKSPTLPVNITGVSTSNPNFDIVGENNVAIGIPGGESRSFTVAPHFNLPGGTYTTTVRVTQNGGGNISFNVNFTVNGPSARYDIALSVTETHNFPAAVVGYALTNDDRLDVRVSNTGNQPTGELNVTASTVSGKGADAFFISRGTLPSILATIDVDVSINDKTFTVVPKDGLPIGTHEATVTVGVVGGISESFNVSFTVNGPEEKYDIALSIKNTYYFPGATVDYGERTERTVTVTNTGNRATGELDVSISDASAFTISTGRLDSIVAGGVGAVSSGTGLFTVVPKVGLPEGTHTAKVTVSGANGISAEFDVSFTVNEAGYGISLGITGTHTFPALPRGYADDTLTPREVMVTNTGDRATGELSVSISGPNSGDFTIRGRLGSIDAGATKSFDVVPKTGLEVGTHEATVTVSGGTNNISESFNVRFRVNSAGYGISLSRTGTYNFPSAAAGYTVAPTSLDVAVTNTGNQPTGDLDVSVSDPDAFTISTGSLGSIEVGGTTTFSVVPKMGLENDYYFAEVTVTGANDILGSFSVSFTVNEPGYGISLNVPKTFQFPGVGDIGYGTQAGLTVTVTNTGNQPTGDLDVSVSNGTAFEIEPGRLDSIDVGGTGSFKVTPRPGLDIGTYRARVTVISKASGSPSFDVSFTVGNALGGCDVGFGALALLGAAALAATLKRR